MGPGLGVATAGSVCMGCVWPEFLSGGLGTLRSEAPGAGWVLPLLPSSQRGAGFMGPADGVARGAFAAPFLRWAISIRICCSVLSSNGRPGCSASACCFMAKGTGLGGAGIFATTGRVTMGRGAIELAAPAFTPRTLACEGATAGPTATGAL